MTQQTKQSILDLLRSRELQLAENAIFCKKPREVLKEKKIKRQNNISRLSEETQGFKVSDETCPLASTSSTPLGTGTSSLSLESVTSSPGREDIVSKTAITTSRGFSGVSLQHCCPGKNRSGVKVFVNLQTPEQAITGEITMLTAELKRSDRLREYKKPYEHDSPEFDTQVWQQTLKDLREMKAQHRRPYCIGRLHDRGARTEWYPDMMLLGLLDDQGSLEKCVLNIHGQEYEIDMSAEMSDRQQKIFLSSGFYGELKNNRPVPQLRNAPTRKL